MDKTRSIVKISKFLSWLLRHGINDRKLDMDSEGFVSLDDVMKQSEMTEISIEDIQHVVDTNDKKRFTIEERTNGEYKKIYIRANQGHSKDIGDKINDENLLTLIKEPLALCIHGTDMKSYHSIKKMGISPMKRKHIHFALSIGDDVISGIRGSAKVLIYIDMDKAMKCGKTFYLSSNKVILTSDMIEPELFDHVEFK